MNTIAVNTVECLAQDALLDDDLCTTYFMGEVVGPSMPGSVVDAARETGQFMDTNSPQVGACTIKRGELPGLWRGDALLEWGTSQGLVIYFACALRTDSSGRQWQHTIY